MDKHYVGTGMYCVLDEASIPLAGHFVPSDMHTRIKTKIHGHAQYPYCLSTVVMRYDKNNIDGFGGILLRFVWRKTGQKECKDSVGYGILDMLRDQAGNGYGNQKAAACMSPGSFLVHDY